MVSGFVGCTASGWTRSLRKISSSSIDRHGHGIERGRTIRTWKRRTRLRRCAPTNSGQTDGGLGEQTTPNILRESRSTESLGRRAVVGIVTSACLLAWPLLPSIPFTMILTVLCVLGQYDYYRIAESQGYLPAMRTGIITTILMMLSLIFADHYSEAVIPICSTLICCYLLFRENPRIATIADLSTTLAGLFYAGLLPSFYVRLHTLNYTSHTLLGTWLSSLPWYPLGQSLTTSGALTILVSFIAGGTADLVRRALGFVIPKSSRWRSGFQMAASFVCNVLLTMVGAYTLSWPRWRLLGFVYGTILGLCGLIGRLTAPMFERADGKSDDIATYRSIFKRTDSFVFLAPLAYYFVLLFLP